MSYNGSGTFQINTSGQPVVAGTVISSTAFNALTADLATGLSTAITKDGQTTTTARIPFAAGINSSSATDSTSSSTGSIITSGGVGIAKALNVGSATDSSSISTGSIVTAGGVGVAKNLYVGVNANIAGTLDVTGAVTVTNPVINNIKLGYTTTATAAGTTTLTAASNYQQFFTGTLAQTIVLPVTSTLALGMAYHIENNSTGTLTVQSSGGNTITTIPAGVTTQFTCILITGTTAASWDYDHIGFATITGTGNNVLATSPTITTPTISQLSSASATALTLQSAGTTAVTIDTSQNVGIGTTTPNSKLTSQTASTSTSVFSFATQLNNSFASNSSISALGFHVRADVNGTGVGGAIAFSGGGASDGSGNLVFCVKPTGNIATVVAPSDEKMRIDSSGNVLVTSAAGLGYGTGSGGTVTQATNKSTGVTLNKPTGQITMNNAALSAGTVVNFRFTNSVIGLASVVVVNGYEDGVINYGAYRIETQTTASGSAVIRITNISGGSLSEAVTISFAVIKGSTS